MRQTIAARGVLLVGLLLLGACASDAQPSEQPDDADVSSPDAPDDATTDALDDAPEDGVTEPDTGTPDDTSGDPRADGEDVASGADAADTDAALDDPDALDAADAADEPDAVDPPDITEEDTATGSFCNPAIGAVAPLRVCSAAEPCTNVTGAPITTFTDVPTCRTTDPDRPMYNDGAPLPITTSEGTRWICGYGPLLADTERRPLVIFMHGAQGNAGNVYNSTSLREKMVQARSFFISVQGRNLHWVHTQDGPHFDIYHRDLSSPSTNPDIAFLDTLIDETVASFAVDPRQIYLMGWSNGGFMAQLYGIARHQTPTPGGNRIAAVAVYTAADPFHNSAPGMSPSCRLATYPQSQLPIFIISRSCDIVACDEAQAADLIEEGFPIAPGHVVGTWVEDLQTRVMNPNVQRRIIAANGQEAPCTGARFCTALGASTNHLRWPDGVADGSGVDHEDAMLLFLAQHPRP